MADSSNIPLENIVLGNIQGLYPKSNQTKVLFLKELAIIEDPMCIALTETHLHSEVKDADIEIENYSPFRVERDGKKCGGVILYIRNDECLDAKQILSISNGQVEVIAVHLTSKDLVVINCYRPPQASQQNFISAINQVAKVVEDLPRPTPDVILCGDFNFPNIKWPEGTLLSGGTLDQQAQAKALLEVADKALLTQQIITPTRLNNILDLYFTNNHESVNTYRTDKTILSDHNIVVINTTYKRNKCEKVEKTAPRSSPFSEYNFFSEEIKWEELDQCFSRVDWEQVMGSVNTEDMLQTLLDKLVETCQPRIPARRHREDNCSNIPRDRRILMRKRATLNKQLIKANTNSRKSKITTKIMSIEQQLKQSHINQRMQEENKAIIKIKRNPKFFYSYCKRYSKIKNRIGPLKDKEGNVITDPKLIADLLLKQYCRIFSVPQQSKTVNNPNGFFAEATGEAQITDITITAEGIEKAIKELKPNAAPGPDGVPAILLLKCSKSLARPISMLWRRSLDAGMIPVLLKKLIICPIHKGGDKGMAENYRPVALTSHLIKIFEKCVRDEIVAHMEDHHLFNNDQHGFRRGRSCLSKLLAHYDWVLHSLAEGKNVDVVFLDFAKAFDKVDHGILLHKIKSLGITGKL